MKSKKQKSKTERLCKCGCEEVLKSPHSTFRPGHRLRYQAKKNPWYKRIQKGTEDECWLFLKHDGIPYKSYGQCLHKGKVQRVSRLVLEKKLGRVLKPKHLACHSCDNPPCCNPKHLFEGTDALNAKDRNNKGRARGGSSIEESNPATKITYAMVLWVRRKYKKEGISYAKLALLFTKTFGIPTNAARMHALFTRPWGRETTKLA